MWRNKFFIFYKNSKKIIAFFSKNTCYVLISFKQVSFNLIIFN